MYSGQRRHTVWVRSSLASFPGTIIAVLKVYFDGSGKEGDPQAKFVTMAGFAAPEELWSYFDDQWLQILRERGDPSFMHMKDAIQHTGNFAGWDAGKTNFLIQGLIGLLQEVTVGNKRFCGFRCTVDLIGHEAWKARNNIPPVAQLCANIAFGRMLAWYGEFPDPIISGFDVYFDRGEPFLDILMRQWNNKVSPGQEPWWHLVRKLAPAEMQTVPALQAADMLAWSHNRLKTTHASGWAGRLATQISNGVQCWHYDLTDHVLATIKNPNKYGFYT
jgi:hypothetical protein